MSMILGMNFLAKYHMVLDCSNKEAVLTEPEKLKVKFLSNKKVELASIISMLKARKLTRKTHTAYLAHVETPKW